MKQRQFKTYSQHQLMLLPPSLEELIPSTHVVRVVNEVIDGLEIEELLSRYKGGGTSSYHPRLLLKILVYGYLNNSYSSRELEELTRSNIYFMWLSGMQTPDHNTINRFRGERLKGLLKPIFTQIVGLLVEAGLVSLKTLYIDGTNPDSYREEANANKYTFVWGKSIKNYKTSIVNQLEELWAYTESVTQQELKEGLNLEVTSLNKAKILDTISKINTALATNTVDTSDITAKKKLQKAKAKLRYGEEKWAQKVEDYKAQEAILAGRNSYSKTDTDATFMRMKEDKMKNGQLKAGYNLQISTENQCILNYDLYPNPTDTLTLIDHIDNFKALYHQYPTEVVADSGYGSEENYDYLENNEITAYVKYNYFHKELQEVSKLSKSNKELKKPFIAKYLYYNAIEDYFVCPMGQHMEQYGQAKRKNKSGFVQHYTIYKACNCEGCPLRGVCHKSKGNRILHFNPKLSKHKEKAKERLTSEEGKKHRSQRPVDVEAVFGNIKQNKKFRRFHLRGKKKVSIETG